MWSQAVDGPASGRFEVGRRAARAAGRIRDAVAGAPWRRASVRVPLPQHPHTPRCPSEIELAGLARQLGDDFVETGFATHELPMLAAMMTVAVDESKSCVIDIADDVGVAGALCAAAMPDRPVAALRPSRGSAAMVRQVAADNALSMHVADYAGGGGRAIAGAIAELDTEIGLVVVGMSDSAAVLRSLHAPIRQHRPVLLVPSRGAEGGLHERTRRLLRRLGYTGYRLHPRTTFAPRRRWSNGRRAAHTYWLLTPAPVDEQFVDRFDWWVEELAATDPVGHRRPTRLSRAREAVVRDGLWQAAVDRVDRAVDDLWRDRRRSRVRRAQSSSGSSSSSSSDAERR